LTEPVIVARGEHEGRLELLDQDGRQLGFAERRTHFTYDIRDTDGQCVLIYDICDTDGQCVLAVRKVKLSLRERPTGWAYDVSQPYDTGITTLRRTGSWWKGTYSITEGGHQIGLLRGRGPLYPTNIVREPLCSVEDERGHLLWCVQLARKPSFMKNRVALVVEIENQTPDQLRKVAVAATVIADHEMMPVPASGGGA
jgi:hypothetical protein